MVGLSNLTDCTTEATGTPGQDDYVAAQADEEGMQIFEKVYSMRYRRKLFPVRRILLCFATARTILMSSQNSHTQPPDAPTQCLCPHLCAPVRLCAYG